MNVSFAYRYYDMNSLDTAVANAIQQQEPYLFSY